MLDEPTIGIDPIQVVETRQLIKSLGQEHTLILSSHILPEVSMICDRVIIIHEGQIVAVDDPVNLGTNLSGVERVELEVKAGSAVLMHSSTLHGGYPNKTKGSVRITVCERYCPLQKMPYLKNPKAPLKIPYTGVDYNKILD